ncbi:DUF2683 family protein [Sphingobacterium faecale]|uniref:Uncharacterized protein n=1 Tax=Sphingobacterium faecale TaxID=2803775 RepID=A0ABS1R0L7_9SPHI|nr:DUF2683 family protein [Sphingobacterium faecale]MBL1408237.1 hypothetical protein [Sphingobacterium faecale]
MTTLTIHIESKKSEKAIKAVLDTLALVHEERGYTEEYPEHVVDGVNLAKQEMQAGRVKAYNGLKAILVK